MPEIRYTTARDAKWIAMAAPSCVLVVDSSIGDDRAADLWSSVHDDTGARAVLDALTRGGISSAPQFAFATLPTGFGNPAADITVIVRGEIEVTLLTPEGRSVVSGSGVSTWVERLVIAAIGIEIGARESAPQSKASLEAFRLVEGTAPVTWLEIGPEAAEPLREVLPTLTAAASEAIDPPSAAPAVAIVDDPGATITDVGLESVVQPEASEDQSGYDFLFGETVVRTVEDAAVRVATDQEPEIPTAGDHDGKTAIGLTSEERRAARRARRAVPARSSTAPRFSLESSTGEKEPIDRPIVIGRAPSANQVSSASVPRLITVGGPDQDISRNHVQVSIEGGTVVVTDLHSRNGTMVTLPGRPPQQLRGGQPTAVIPGAIIDLGSGVTFAVGEG